MMIIALALTLLLPDRLPSLIVLVGFWIPPALAGWVMAGFLQRSIRRFSTTVAAEEYPGKQVNFERAIAESGWIRKQDVCGTTKWIRKQDVCGTTTKMFALPRRPCTTNILFVAR